MVPYRYEVPQPTPWLWVSEGITDYYADLAQVRGAVIPDTGFYHLTAGKIDEVNATVPVALTDASLSTWVHPTDGTAYLYYPKGSLAGFMLDIIVRDASDGRQSLDSVMRAVYNSTYKHQRGFAGVDWWGAVSRAAGGRSFAEFNRRYIDGREPFPWDSILPLAGLRLVPDTTREPRLGIMTMPDSGRMRVMQVEPGSAASQAGVAAGDVLVSIGDIPVSSPDFGQQFRARYVAAGQPATAIPLVVRRGSQTLTFQAQLQYEVHVEHRIEADPAAGDKARRVRDGILRG
jgi:predicted metalloprotease with PDZ domain